MRGPGECGLPSSPTRRSRLCRVWPPRPQRQGVSRRTHLTGPCAPCPYGSALELPCCANPLLYSHSTRRSASRQTRAQRVARKLLSLRQGLHSSTQQQDSSWGVTLADHGHRVQASGAADAIDWREFYKRPLPQGLGPIPLLRRFGLPVGDVDLQILAFGPRREPASSSVARAIQSARGRDDPSRPRMRRQRLLLGASRRPVPPGTTP